MKKKIINYLAFWIVVGGLLTNATVGKTQGWAARVIRVKDGDTYVVGDFAKSYTIRLNHVDAPETEQDWGREATKSVTTTLLGKIVVWDTTGRDVYGRILANGLLNGVRLDSLLIRKGWAWHYENYDNNPMLEAAMQAAVAEKIGLWRKGANKVCPPWLWRGYDYKKRKWLCSG